MTTVATTARPVQWGLGGLALSMLLASLGTSIANVALPALAEAFAAPFQAVQWVVLAYLLAITALIVSAGRLGDLAGRRRLLVGGLALYTGASVLCGLAPALGTLIAARAVQGAGAAVMMALTMALAGAAVPKERTGRAMGLLGTMSAIGTAAGPSLGGLLLAGPGWRAVFLAPVPLGVLALFLTCRHLPAEQAPSGTRPRFDHLGTAILAGTLAAYALAMTTGRGSFGLGNAALLVAAALGTALFVRVQTRAASPLLDLTAFRSAALTGSLLASALVSTVMMATLVVGPFYLTRGLGLPAALTGLVMSAGPAVTALTSSAAGRFADRLGAGRMTTAGLAGILAGSLLLAAMPRSSGVAGYAGSLILTTASYALFQTANNTSVMAGAAPERRGVISGVLNLSRNLGLITGASVMGAVFAVAASTSDMTSAAPEAVATGMRVTFLTAAALVALALAAMPITHRR
ncbi:MFS transporter [Longispora albida]|uniref:MFS transporter n=1 Tax=Longispora albida TaxID=203523 RepID=UPI00037A1612|nr:MFS transporter [Longispora albida]